MKIKNATNINLILYQGHEKEAEPAERITLEPQEEKEVSTDHNRIVINEG